MSGERTRGKLSVSGLSPLCRTSLLLSDWFFLVYSPLSTWLHRPLPSGLGSFAELEVLPTTVGSGSVRSGAGLRSNFVSRRRFVARTTKTGPLIRLGSTCRRINRDFNPTPKFLRTPNLIYPILLSKGTGSLTQCDSRRILSFPSFFSTKLLYRWNFTIYQ